MITGKGWRFRPPTDKQIRAIHNMSSSLGYSIKVPETKGECCDLIGQLKKIIDNHLQVSGKINTNSWDPEDESMDFMNNDTF